LSDWRKQKLRIRVTRYDHENYQKWSVILEGTVAELFDAVCDWSELGISLEKEFEEES